MTANTNTPTVDERSIGSIQVGTGVRKEMGDIDALAASIRDGLLQAIVINWDGKLIAGAQRLEACRRLGWRAVPVNIVPLDRIVRGEYAENEFR